MKKQSRKYRPVVLLIMDGFGLADSDYYNAVRAARKPNFDRYWERYPHTTLGASGLSVGLPDGQMGNSEVGHLNFGAGRIVYQEVTRIDKSISDGDFFTNQAFLNAINRAKDGNRSLHLLGLLSDGCVHSSEKHLYALLKLARDKRLDRVYIHAFLDGRDTSPFAGVNFVAELERQCASIGVGKLVTVIGRYYAMDRDKRWQRTQVAYDLLCAGKGEISDNLVETIKAHYDKDNTDEFMEPIIKRGTGPQTGLIENGDSVIFFNFRADRARQLCRSLTEENFAFFPRQPKAIVHLVSLTLFDVDLKAEVAFPQQKLDLIFPQIISERGLRQLKMAETEKYPHVTFFFNGGVEKSYAGEDRVMIPSPQVATYDLKPEMSAFEVTEEVVKRIESDAYDVIILNYANCDMVGHTGVFEAAVKAVEAVDTCIGKVIETTLSKGGLVMLTADHGNADIMKEPDGKPFTAHTTSPVPFILIADGIKVRLREKGVLADVAPTMLEFLGLEKPAPMSGLSLIAEYY